MLGPSVQCDPAWCLSDPTFPKFPFPSTPIILVFLLVCEHAKCAPGLVCSCLLFLVLGSLFPLMASGPCLDSFSVRTPWWHYSTPSQFPIPPSSLDSFPPSSMERSYVFVSFVQPREGKLCALVCAGSDVHSADLCHTEDSLHKRGLCR